jgi:DNA-binding XRE family transcriptional regulator
MWERTRERIRKRRADHRARAHVAREYQEVMDSICPPPEPRLATLLRYWSGTKGPHRPERLADLTFLRTRLRQARELAGLNQSEVVAAIGLQQSMLSKIETGRRRLSLWELTLLLRKYGQRREYVLRWHNERDSREETAE